MPDIDLKAAINAISDVIQNRPRPLRENDQIYMKAGDMVLQSEMVARWADGKRLAFIGDGDAISVSVAYLHRRGIIPYGPSTITVFDFDQRVCSAVERFADHERLDNLHSLNYNCFEAFPQVGRFDAFYTNPPWGASNGGASVNVFSERGMEAIAMSGNGLIVIADDSERLWAREVLANTQRFALEKGFYVSKMQPKMHEYHLDDAPDLKSCNLFIESVKSEKVNIESTSIKDPQRLANFYGAGQHPRVRYVVEKKRVDYGRAPDDEYEFVTLES